MLKVFMTKPKPIHVKIADLHFLTEIASHLTGSVASTCAHLFVIIVAKVLTLEQACLATIKHSILVKNLYSANFVQNCLAIMVILKGICLFITMLFRSLVMFVTKSLDIQTL